MDGAKDLEGAAERVGKELLVFPIEGATDTDGVNDGSLEGEGANDVWLFGTSDWFAIVGTNEGASVVEFKIVGEVVGIPTNCRNRSVESSQCGPVKELPLQAQ